MTHELYRQGTWYIESHLGDDLSLELIARDVGVSRYNLPRAFSTATACGLALYVRARRLSEAAKALVNGAPDILSLSLDTGYGSHEAFTRAFKQHFGLMPEQARAQRPTTTLKLMEPIRCKLQPPRASRSFGLAIRVGVVRNRR